MVNAFVSLIAVTRLACTGVWAVCAASSCAIELSCYKTTIYSRTSIVLLHSREEGKGRTVYQALYIHTFIML